jgi:hypothetical protein
MQVEQWVNLVIEVEDVPNPPKYAVSNFGRIKSFQKPGPGEIIKGSVIQGYRSLNIRLPKGKSFNRYIHKVIAEAFLEKPSDKHIFVIHRDFDKQNNHFENLKYVTRIEMTEHHRSNPNVLNKKIPTTSKQYKLTETKVRLIKKMVKEDKTRLKMIAKQFGITHTQLNRIRSGENWGNVTIDE